MREQEKVIAGTRDRDGAGDWKFREWKKKKAFSIEGARNRQWRAKDVYGGGWKKKVGWER